MSTEDDLFALDDMLAVIDSSLEDGDKKSSERTSGLSGLDDLEVYSSADML